MSKIDQKEKEEQACNHRALVLSRHLEATIPIWVIYELEDAFRAGCGYAEKVLAE